MRRNNVRRLPGDKFRYVVFGVMALIFVLMIAIGIFTWTGHEIPCSWYDNARPLDTPMRCWPNR